MMMSHASAANCLPVFNETRGKLHSEEQVNLCELTQGKPVLVVNTASNCGFTSQFKQLEQVHQRYKDQGLVVIGFPSNDFFQENSDEKDTAKVCYINYGVTFTMLEPGSVRGDSADPIFKYLSQQTASVKWNFYKFLISADGKEIKHFPSNTKPDSDQFQQAVKAIL
nr:glutathione peroxidase [Motilimonas pumila]